MPGIFISYRRDDSAGYAGRLYDRLCAHFDESRVFMDVDRIKPGQDFVSVLQHAVDSCDAMLVLIGKRWLDAADEAGRRRLDDLADFVRLEIEAGLKRGIAVIPVLLQNASMPRREELPESLRDLSRRQALELSDGRWKYDVGRLIEAISGRPQAEPLLPEKPAAGSESRSPTHAKPDSSPQPRPAPGINRLDKRTWQWKGTLRLGPEEIMRRAELAAREFKHKKVGREGLTKLWVQCSPDSISSYGIVVFLEPADKDSTDTTVTSRTGDYPSERRVLRAKQNLELILRSLESERRL